MLLFIKKLVTLSVFLFLIYSCSNRETKLNLISLTFRHTLTNEKLDVSIIKRNEEEIEVHYHYDPANRKNDYDIQSKSYKISLEQFNLIADKILNINRNNIELETKTQGLDGSITIISFKEEGNPTILNHYKIWSPHSSFKKRNLIDYIEAFNSIAILAKESQFKLIEIED